MSSMKTSRNRKARQASRPSLTLECLESRLPLAALPAGGNVTAQLIGSTLFLTGDSLGNQVVVASAKAGTMAVLGNGTTINGATTPFVTTKAVTNIVANLNGGNDVVGFGNDAVGFANQLGALGITPTFDPGDLQDKITKAGGVAAFSLPGSLTVTTGDGNDGVGIIGTVGGSVAANLGSALTGKTDGNAFAIGDPSGSTLANRVGGAVSVVGGAQNDSVGLYGTSVNGGVTMALGNGVNATIITGTGGASIGSFAFTGGTGDDSAYLVNGLTVRNGVNIFTGSRGQDTVGLYGPTVIGDVIVNTGTGGDADLKFDDYVELGGDFRRNVTVTTGTGNDEVYLINAKIGLGLSVNTGEGNDVVGIQTTYVDQNAVIDTAGGDDEVYAQNLTVRFNLFAYLGAGNDFLGLANTKALAAFLYGGTGTNTLGIDAASKTGIRTLRTYQFQRTVA